MDRVQFQLRPWQRHYRLSGSTAQGVADRLGLKLGTADQYVTKTGHVNAHTADQLATAIGMHPSQIWPEEWADWLSRNKAQVSLEHQRRRRLQRRGDTLR